MCVVTRAQARARAQGAGKTMASAWHGAMPMHDASLAKPADHLGPHVLVPIQRLFGRNGTNALCIGKMIVFARNLQK